MMWAVDFGGGGLRCAQCRRESEDWHLMHRNDDDHGGGWLCLSCTAKALRTIRSEALQ